MEDIYLTPELKAYYMKDFTENVLNCQDDFWKLDADLINALTAINENKNIQTLYSKRHSHQKPIGSDESYIMFAYTREVEQQLFKQIIPDITAKHCWSVGFDETTCYYAFRYPEPKAEAVESGVGLACTEDKSYFNISRIRIYLTSHAVEKHNEFWADITAALSAVC